MAAAIQHPERCLQSAARPDLLGLCPRLVFGRARAVEGSESRHVPAKQHPSVCSKMKVMDRMSSIGLCPKNPTDDGMTGQRQSKAASSGARPRLVLTDPMRVTMAQLGLVMRLQ